MKTRRSIILMLILSLLSSGIFLFINIPSVKAQELPYPPSPPDPASFPGVLSNQPKLGLEQLLPWEVDYDQVGQLCEGVNVLLDPAEWPNLPYLDERNSWVGKDEYVVEEVDPLKYREIITYVPMILIETEEWYSHKFDFTTTTTQSTEISFDAGIGIRKGWDKIIYQMGESTLTVDEYISGWTEYVPNGETWVIYVKTRFLWVYGMLKFQIYIPSLEFYEEIVEWDAILLEEIEWDNIYVVKYNSGDVPLEVPYSSESFYEEGTYGYLQDEIFREWHHIEQQTNSISFSMEEVTGYSDWYGIYLGLHFNYVTTVSNEYGFKHTFYKEAENTNEIYFDVFHIRYDNTFSVNIESNRLPKINFLSPNPEEEVSGTTRFRVLVNDPDDNPLDINLRAWLSIDDVQNMDDYEIGVDIGNLRREPNTFEWYWDIITWQVPDNKYYMIILTQDRFGDTVLNNKHFFYFQNDDIDNTPSTGEIINPSNGASKILGDDIYFSAIAIDEAEGINSVHFRVGVSGDWYSATYSSLYGWHWWWYDQPGIGTVTVYCRVTDDEGHQVIIDSVTFNIVYGMSETYQVTPITYATYLGGTQQGKYDDNNYYRVCTTGLVFWGLYFNWKSETDFYFNPIPQLINIKVELQIAPCTSDVSIVVYYSEGGSSIFYPNENTYNTQSFTLPSGKHVNRVRIIQSTWWCNSRWLAVDFIRVRYRLT
ncbi:MAG: hypothetical protein ACFFBT_08815 [Promethearchaeota archaeon]